MSNETAVAPQQAPSLLATMAARFGVESSKMLATLKATAFKGDVSNEQMMALLIVANEYGLNPWTKEIYAFPDKNNGIVPVLGVDGWARMMNSHSAFDGIEFVEGGDGNSAWCEAIIYRKDRAHPTKVREYLSECKRNTGPWGSHPKRMLRHKAMIQCARVAFSYGGIYDDDEAAQIIERDVTPITGTTTQGATAKLREVAIINHGGEDVLPETTRSDSDVNAGQPEHMDNAGGTARSEAPSPAPGNVAQPDAEPARSINTIRSMKSIDTLDLFMDSIDTKDLSPVDAAAITTAYKNRREVLEAGPKGGKRGEME